MAGLIPRDTIDQIIEQNDIVPVVEQYVKLSKKSSANYFGLCPFHAEKTPSFSVSPSKQIFYCFSCHKGGNVVRFIQEIEHVSFPEALEILAKRANIEIPRSDQRRYEAQREERSRQQALMLESARFFYRSLQAESGVKARSYMKQRGFSQATLTGFGIGYADESWDSLTRYLSKQNFTVEEQLNSGLVRKSSRGNLIDLFRDRIIFPIFPSHGRHIVAFGGRLIETGEPKYINSPETVLYRKGQHLFAMNRVRQLRPKVEQIIIAEGYLDVMALHQAGFPQTVASLGTALTEAQARLIKQYVNQVVLAYDGDEAGIRAALRAIDIFDAVGCEVRVLAIPGQQDPDEFIKTQGVERFRALLADAVPAVDYRLDLILKESLEANGEFNATRYHARAIELLAGLPSAVARELVAAKVAEQLGVARDTLLYDVSSLLRKHGQRATDDSQDALKSRFGAHVKTDGVPSRKERFGRFDDDRYELMTLILTAMDTSLFDEIETTFDPKMFRHPTYRKLAEQILPEIASKRLNLTILCEVAEEVSTIECDLKQKLLPLIMALDDDHIRPSRELLLETWKRVQNRADNRRKKELLANLENHAAATADSRREWLRELEEIDRRISQRKESSLND